jgi:hypothetical protein
LQQSDLIVSAIRSTVQRNKIVDQTTPWEFPKLGLLIPIQDETANINAVVKPFQWPVIRHKLIIADVILTHLSTGLDRTNHFDPVRYRRFKFNAMVP